MLSHPWKCFVFGAQASVLLMVPVVNLFLFPLFVAGGTLLRLYTKNPEAISYGMRRLSVICTMYLLCGVMDVIVGVIRGMGYGIMPMLVSLTGACLFRVVWIFTVFQKVHTLECLYYSYPISWALTFSAHFICFLIVFRKEKEKIS